MKPLSLTIKNLRSFRAERTFDFRGLRLCAIVGDTGAGKTSILEAITYALYDRSTWSGRNVKELIATGADSMAVTFTFEVDGHGYTVTRITRRKGQPSHRLQCPTLNIDVSGGDVKKAIEDALHLSEDTFLHTVLLPQGKHAELLIADKADRNRMIGELFRLDEIDGVAALAKEQALQLESVLSLRRRDLNAFGDLERQLEAMHARIAAAKQHQELATTAKARVEALDFRICEAAQTIAAQGSRLDEVAGASQLIADLRRLEVKSREFETEFGQIHEELAKARAAHQEAQRELVDLSERGLDTEILNGCKVHLEAYAGEARELTREQRELQYARDLLPAKKAVFSGHQHARIQAEEALTRVRVQLSKAEQSAEVDRILVTRLESGIGNLNRAKESLASANTSFEQQTMRIADLKRQLDGALVASDRARAEAIKAQGLLEELRVIAGAAAIASHLHAGDDCPVCQRELPTNFVAPKNADLSTAVSCEAQARAAAAKANDRVSTVRAQHEASQSQIDDCRTRLETAEATLQQAIIAISTGHDGDPQHRFEKVKAQLSVTDDEIKALRVRHQEVADGGLEAAKAETVAASGVASLESQITTLAANIEAREQTCVLKESLLPDAFRPAKQDEIDVEVARKRINDALAITDATVRRETAAAKLLVEANAALVSLERDRSQEIFVPQSGTLALLDKIANTLSLGRLPHDQTAQSRWVNEVEANAQRETIKAQNSLTTADAAKQQAEEARQAEVEALGAEPSAVVLEAALSKNNAERDLEMVQTRIEQRRTLGEKVARIEPVYLGVKTLKDELGARRFLEYASEQRQEHLLAEASRIFGEMSDGRYGFTANFQIFDSLTNEERVPQTLSGGEKFQASLALSLAVVEIAANAGAKIGCLFLDEGFATLNAELVEIAMLSLRRRARQGRSIYVISHLREVTQFVDSTFQIEATEDGSDYKIFHGAIETDDTAMTGLLSQLSGG